MVQIGSRSEYLQLILDQSNQETLVATLQVGRLSATTTVAHYPSFQDLALFFTALMEDWRGWEGTREWESLEGDLRIEARHAYGHVQLRVTLCEIRHDWGNDGWTARADLTIDPGEQLSRIADDAMTFLAA